ncbi:MAG: hypothetical protein CMM93_00290 [Rickettsiales bacterium]|nr:hypothetical protein [Rickettsiales bacterium]|tara:strand:- start:1590 stop:2693 length:1104 start_codon:yes stop_codon:yes gene_type:complete
MIYLDYNATAPMRPEVLDAMQRCAQLPCNPSSVHKAGREARQKLEAARKTVADALSVFPGEVIFTASGTEANNLALKQAGERPILVSACEHDSIQKTAARLGGDTIRVDQYGLIDVNDLEAKLRLLGRPALVSILYANNETGVIQSMTELAQVVHRYDGLLHIDAVQALGKIPVDVNLLGADMVTLCAHKLGGPVGIGALIVRQDIPVTPQLYGGNQEGGRRAGTESVCLASGFAEAIRLSDFDAMQQLGQWMRAMEADLCDQFGGLIIVGHTSKRLPNTSCLLMPPLKSEMQLMQLDLAGICIGAGSACSSGRIAPSRVLTGMGFAPDVAACAIRVSAGWQTTQDDLQQFAGQWADIIERALKKVA